ncbi:MAG: 50S ribosome-binding GTPase, partial [Armatimonadetes bacterium]|nr:50S ribosome-binding GTPase [Armatimonadota bacterium]
MKMPIIGLPGAGKTTLFRALAAGHLPSGDVQVAAVPVPDPRLDLIAEREKPKKTTYAALTLLDVAAMRPGDDKATHIDKLHALVGDADALILVVQAFGELNRKGQPLNPLAELEELLSELLLTDLAIAEARLERVKREHRAKPKGVTDVEHALLE